MNTTPTTTPATTDDHHGLTRRHRRTAGIVIGTAAASALATFAVVRADGDVESKPPNPDRAADANTTPADHRNDDELDTGADQTAAPALATDTTSTDGTTESSPASDTDTRDAAEPPATGDTAESTAAAGEPLVDGPGGQLDGAWSTDGARIVDGDGDEVRIRGVNWFGFETAAGVPHGLWSRNMEEMLDQVADLGFNVLRVPFSASIIDGENAVQGLNEHENPDLAGLSSLEVLDKFVEAAGERGLGVILDRHTLAPDNRHHLWYDEQFPPERLVSDWEFLAERYRDVPNVIGADLYNEPHDDACWGCGDEATDWKLAATEAGDALHAIEPDWLIFVEGVEQADGASCDPGAAAADCTWWGGDLSRADTDPVELTVPDKVVYSPHEYATSVFRQPWFDDPSFPDNMPAIWERFWGDLELNDVAPVMVGELGTTLDAEIDAVWLESLMAYLDEVGAGFTFWTFNPNSGDTGGILEEDWITVDTEKLAYLEPYLLGPFDPVPAG
ncbi:MAG: glycoside hydrolase family 5 protein [Actinomycetota bacterium]